MITSDKQAAGLIREIAKYLDKKKATVKKEVKKAVKKVSGFKFSWRSRKKLERVHPQLIKLVNRALELSVIDFGISEGVRTANRQKSLVKAGKSWVKVSNHQIEAHKSGYGHAVDVYAAVDAPHTWDWDNYVKINKAFKQASDELGIKYTWGGVWAVRDGVHFQIEGIA